jgi:hypothetical protein
MSIPFFMQMEFIKLKQKNNKTLLLQKSRMLQVQGIKAAAVVVYRNALITREMRYHRLSRRVSNKVKKTYHWK